MSEGSRRRVTYAQLDTLWEFLNDHRDIATGYNKTARARDTAKRLWQNIAESLNAHGDGAVKDWKGWSKYWNDYKSKLKKTVAAIRSSLQRTGGGPSDAPSLSEVEQKFLQILGDSFGSGLSGIRVEPFNQETEGRGIEGAEDTQLSSVGRPTIVENIQENSPQPGPSRLVTPPPFLRTPTPSPRPSPRRSPRTRHPPQHPVAGLRGSPSQRRRHRRREPPMSQEVARRTLISIAQESAAQARNRNEVLLELVREIKGIHEILRTRLPVPELPETPNLNLS